MRQQVLLKGHQLWIQNTCSKLPPPSAILYVISISDPQFLIYKMVLTWRVNEIIHIKHFSQCIAHDRFCRNVSLFPLWFSRSDSCQVNPPSLVWHFSNNCSSPFLILVLNLSFWRIYINGQCFRHLGVPCLPKGISCALYIMKTTYHTGRITTDLRCNSEAKLKRNVQKSALTTNLKALGT